MASIKDVEQVTDDLEGLVSDLRSELRNGADFERLAQIADDLSERADSAAQTFSNVNETLQSRIGELSGKGGASAEKSSSGSQAKSSSSS